MYQHVLCSQNFLKFLAANGFSISGRRRHPLLAIKAIIRQIGCKVTLVTRSRLDRGANHSLDPQNAQVSSSCLSEFGAVCARLVFQTANNPKRSDAVQGGYSDRARSRRQLSPGAANVECGDFWGMARPQSLASASAELLQNTPDTRTSRELSIATKMSSPDCKPARMQALKWSRVPWPYRAISNWLP